MVTDISVPVTISLPVSQRECLRLEAERRRLPMSVLVREALDQALWDDGSERDGPGAPVLPEAA